jgi:copper chaperone NosL
MWFRQLSNSHRYWIAAVSVLMILVYFVPLWYISLAAPQYPEGLSMNIWINKITGGSEYDLKNINLLNHYIGMEEIVSASIPELVYMPYILGFMILGALVTVFHSKVYMVLLGIVNLTLVGIIGIYDFWRWEYNYGHNLHPDAPIKIPGMTYQPPLLACKEMLNITACSWPSIGSILLFFSMAILVYVLYKEKKME